MHYMTDKWKSLPQTVLKTLARVRYFCKEQSNCVLWLYDALPHGGERLSHCATVPSTSHLLAALTRLPATILARMKNIRCIYVFWFSIACLVMKKSIPLYVHKYLPSFLEIQSLKPSMLYHTSLLLAIPGGKNWMQLV